MSAAHEETRRTSGPSLRQPLILAGFAGKQPYTPSAASLFLGEPCTH